MSQLDRLNRRLEIKLVYWGPARGGKTTSLRSVHGACDARERGELASVDTEDERTYFFDYAPLDLPRYRDLAIRVHAYTVPGQEAYVETRRRILRGASGVIFVADSTPAAAAATLSSWRQLDDALRAIEGSGTPLPVMVAANKQDLPGASPATAIARALSAAAPTRNVVATVETTALEGRAVVACFRDALVAAVERALGTEALGRGDPERKKFFEALTARFGGGDDGSKIAQAPARRTTTVPVSSVDPDAGGLQAALDASRWLAARDLDVRDLQRERAAGRLLLDLGHLCLAATDIEPLLRSVLASLVMNLDAVSGWIGVPGDDGKDRVYDAMGEALQAESVAHAAQGLRLGASEGRTVPFGAETSAFLPGGESCGGGLFLAFPSGDGRLGWILMVGASALGLPPEADAVLSSAGAFLGLALSRIAATRRLRASNVDLERRVAERTRELLEEKAGLEGRVLERTRQLEDAKRATVDAERRLLDRERAEGVHRLAAGLAHELNNPMGAVRANLEFVREGLERAAQSSGVRSREEAADLLAAVDDARRDVERVTGSIKSLFGDAASSRMEAVRTPLSAAVRDAVRDYGRTVPGAPVPRLVERESVFVGIPPGECARWLFRVLTLLATARPPAVRIEIEAAKDGPRLLVSADEPIPAAATEAMSEVAKEMAKAGGHLEAVSPGRRAEVTMLFPRAVGDAKPAGVATGAPR